MILFLPSPEFIPTNEADGLNLAVDRYQSSLTAVALLKVSLDCDQEMMGIQRLADKSRCTVMHLPE